MVAFEAGRSVDAKRTQQFALLTALVTLPAALPGGVGRWHSPPFNLFLLDHLDALGPPVRLAWTGLLIFYIYAWMRGSGQAAKLLPAIIPLGLLIGPATLDVKSFAWPPQPTQLWATTGLALFCLWRRPASSNSWFCLFMILASGSARVTPSGWVFEFEGALPLHLVIAAAMLTGWVFKDAFAAFLRFAAALTLAALGFSTLHALTPPFQDVGVQAAYLCFLATTCWVWFAFTKQGVYLVSSTALTFMAGFPLWNLTYRGLLRVQNLRAILLVLGGIVSFAIAAAISAYKARGGTFPSSSAPKAARDVNEPKPPG